MSFGPAYDFIVPWLRWSGERGICIGARQQLNFPIDIGGILLIKYGPRGCTKLHNHKIMDDGAIIGGRKCNLLTGGNRKLAWLKLKVGHLYINIRGRSTSSAT